MSIAAFLRQGYDNDEQRTDVFTSNGIIDLVVTAEPLPTAPIELVLWEFNADLHGVSFTPSASDEIVRIPGRVVKMGKDVTFEPDSSFVFPQPGKFFFHMHIAGLKNSLFKIPLKVDLSHGFELGAAGGSTGLVYRIMVRLEQGGRLLFQRPTWALLRNFHSFYGDGRPVVTFLLGDVAEDEYFVTAQKFWQQHSDLMVIGSTIEGVLRFLRGEHESNGSTVQRDWMFGHWGQVNVVAHGFFSAWNVTLLESEPEPFPNHSTTPWQTAEDLADARSRHGKDRLLAPKLKSLDGHSSIAILGCLVGLDPVLTKEIFLLFGGNAPLAGCKMLQQYNTQGERAWQSLRRLYFFLYKSTDGKIIDYRGGKALQQTAATAFAQKYDAGAPDAAAKWAERVNKGANYNKHIPENAERGFVVRVNYRASHKAALEAISALSATPGGPARDDLFVSDFVEDSLGGVPSFRYRLRHEVVEPEFRARELQ